MHAGILVRDEGGHLSIVWHLAQLASVIFGISGERIACLIPCREVRVHICVQVIVDVVCRRVVLWITSDIPCAFALVNADVVDVHGRGKPHVLEVLLLEARRHPEVHDDVVWLL